jgi:hypothetical protein
LTAPRAGVYNLIRAFAPQTPRAKGPSLILLAFLLPFAVYLLALGAVNRRRRPVMVPGAWDFAGVLFAASGFLLVGGPAVLSSRTEEARRFWAAGRLGAGDAAYSLWGFFSLIYLGVVVAGAAFLLWRRRDLTSVYNLDARSAERALAGVFDHFGLQPVRSGNLYFFGAGLQAGDGPRVSGPEGIQPPHYLPPGGAVAARAYEEPAGGARTASPEFLVQSAILEVESFDLMRHVTLRWDPPGSVLRQEVEAELARKLAKAPPADNPAGPWLTLAGLFLIGVCLLGVAALVFYRLYAP